MQFDHGLSLAMLLGCWLGSHHCQWYGLVMLPPTGSMCCSKACKCSSLRGLPGVEGPQQAFVLSSYCMPCML